MSYHFPLPSPSPLLVSPREPESEGLCADCGEDFADCGDRAFTIMAWPDPERIVCPWCAQDFLIEQLKLAKQSDNDDILPILQSVDEIARCKECDRFICGCRDA